MTNFAYNRNTPNGPNNPSADQPLMQTNTNSIQDLIGVDHVTFGINNGGSHNQVQLGNVAGGSGTLPIGIIGNGFETFYSSATAGNGELWFVRGASATGIQLTGPGTPVPARPAAFTSQAGPGTVTGTSQNFLPGGMILFFGLVTGANTSSSGQTIVFPSGGFPNNFFVAFATASSGSSTQNASVTVKTASLSKTGVVFFCPTGNIDNLYWWALGN